MAGTKEIKRRIKSVKNTKKITKAIELVAASKMKRSIASTMASRLYAEYSWEILTSIAKNAEKITHPFFNERDKKDDQKNVLLVIITSNRGLCGAYNAQIIKKTIQQLKVLSEQVSILSIGKKGNVSMERLDQNVVASFNELPDHITLSDIVPISKFITDEYNLERYDKVLIAYTD